MNYILGIDTGGTYTDAVLITKEGHKIVDKAKAFTTHEDLTKGIGKCIDMLEHADCSEITEVHISTTLALNSVLERKFDKIGLVQIDRAIEADPPANYAAVMKDPFYGQRTHNCGETLPAILDIQKKFANNVEYIIVTSPSKSRDNWREHIFAEQIAKTMELEVFCAYDYCDDDDYTYRTVAAMLTLYLMPIIDAWIKSVEDMMREKGIKAQLKIMNAMGKLISCDAARRDPLSTLFSGLAASVTGGLKMTDIEDFLLIDMGGTSSDITRIIGRQFREVKEYSKIDKFTVRRKTMDVQTFGIGGDSYIKLSQSGRPVAGPRKAIPICVMSSSFPYLEEELKSYRRPENYEMLTAQDVDCFIGAGHYRREDLTGLEERVVKYLTGNPHNVFVIAEHFNVDPDALHLDKLVRKGAVKLISVTPTDVLHAEGKYGAWNAAGAKAAISHMAEQMGTTMDVCIAMIRESITETLVKACMQSIANFEKEQFDFDDSKGASFLLESFYRSNGSMLEMKFEINKPIVALGAPAEAWLGPVAERLNTEVMIPEHCEVANAFGAAIAE